MQELLDNEKRAHSESLKLLHDKLDPHGTITGVEDPEEISTHLNQIIEIYIEKL